MTNKPIHVFDMATGKLKEVVYVENSLSNEEKLKQVANDLLPTQEDN